MAIFKALTFDGVNSLDYGIYITGEAVYNAPERAVEMVNIPGKNGALALDQGRFENIEVTYHAGCFADSQADFADKVMKFRNALASRYTYKRLTDEYHPDEYRLGLYKSGLDVDAVRYGTAGEFNIVFDCKPQRFLVDGDREILPTEWTDLHTVTGDMVTVESDGSLAVKSLEVSLEPIQEGSGTPSPTNIRPISGHDEVNVWNDPKYGGSIEWNQLYDKSLAVSTTTLNNVTYTNDGSGTFTVSTSSAVADNTYFYLLGSSGTRPALTANHKILMVGCPSGGAQSSYEVQINSNGWKYDVGNGVIFIAHTDTYGMAIRVAKNSEFSTKEFTPQIFDLTQMFGSTIADYIYSLETANAGAGVAFFRKLFPKPYYAYNSGETTCVSAVNGDPYKHYTTDLSGTRYGGTLDVVSGVLTVDRAMVDLGTLEWGKFETGTKGRYGFVTRSLRSIVKPTDNVQVPYAVTSIGLTPTSANYSWVSGDYVISIDRRSDIGVYWTKYGEATSEEFTTAMNGVQLCYELATPQTYQLTPQQIDLLLGTNHLWSDGEITVEYGVHPYYNPTPFDAKPLIKVTGTGTLGIGEYILTITGTASQTLYIDCETMEIYTLEGTVPTGASSLVSINRNDFPVLEPGTNYISVGSGITNVEIVPRWWRI